MLPALLLATTLFGQSASQNQSPPKVAANESVEVHLGKGYEALKQDRYDDAAEQFRAVLAIDPTLVMRARFPLAIALFEQHKNTEARHELETVRREAGERPSICYYFGRLDLEEQNYKRGGKLEQGDCEAAIPRHRLLSGICLFKRRK
jgi:predicted Zn-dependent protease